ncbi:HindIII family type II restriction endonuclease [Bacillus cereus group sp. BceL305]|uniref:HindIII family type II restriction endonuclease n=1 Tax=Bacillus cereus group sp. BceL305 TaxID=3444980 RepID=UPI0009453FCE
MKKENIFFIRSFVDGNCQEGQKTNTQACVDLFTQELQGLSDDDFVEVIISCFIPDTYKDNGAKEKLYTKLVEVAVGEWWHRIGGTYIVPTKKSGTEDVELILDQKSIVCDAKAFRLGRSQKAPNVKDFLKLASVRTWMNNLETRYLKQGVVQEIVGGLVTYSSLHEWGGESEVYLECSDKDTPVIMLPYEVLGILLKYKDDYEVNELLSFWKYEDHFPGATKSKADYWMKMDELLMELLSLSEDEYRDLISHYRGKIILSVKEFEKLITEEVKEKTKSIRSELESYKDMESLMQYCENVISNFENKRNSEYLERIKAFRKY